MNKGFLLGHLMPFRNNKQLFIEEQSTGDIINAILNTHDKYRDQYKKIAKFFKGNSKEETGRKIWNFLKHNVPYEIEPVNEQKVKSPAAIISTPGDCKSYSIFSAGILRELGIPFAFRFASYKKFDPVPGHVFTVIDPGKSEIWIDPVLNQFNYKKPFYKAIDKIPTMALYGVSGINNNSGEIAGLKDIIKKVGQTIKKGATVVLKVAASPARNAFLLLVSINFTGLATKLSAGWKKNASGLTNLWQGLGGNINALKNAWEKGEKKKRILGIEANNYNAQIGVAPAAAAAAAAPIILKVVDWLKKIGIDPEELVQVGKNALNDKAKQLLEKAITPEAAKEYEFEEIANEAVPVNTATSEATKQGTNILIPVLIGGALIYFIAKKRK